MQFFFSWHFLKGRTTTPQGWTCGGLTWRVASSTTFAWWRIFFTICFTRNFCKDELYFTHRGEPARGQPGGLLHALHQPNHKPFHQVLLFMSKPFPSGVNLRGANLEGSCMPFINLRVADLKNAVLRNCDIRWGVLAGKIIKCPC